MVELLAVHIQSRSSYYVLRPFQISSRFSSNISIFDYIYIPRNFYSITACELYIMKVFLMVNLKL